MSVELSASDLPVQVVYADEVLDWGAANIPKVVLWFYRHLRCDGERLDDREAMPLVLLISLWENREEPLRLSNLPCATPISTLEHRYLKKWRRMGLVFTYRVYYTREEMVAVFGEKNVPATPRVKARIFDVSSLLYNCVQVAHTWREEGYPTAHEAWREERRACRTSGSKVPRAPHPRFPPSDFILDIELPLHLAVRIAGDVYQFVPKKWQQRAQEITTAVPVQIVPVRDCVPVQIVPVQPRTGTNRTGHLGSTSLREGTLSEAESGPPSGPPSPSSEQMFQSSSPTTAGTGPPSRLPTGKVVEGQAGPAGVPSQGERKSSVRPAGSRVEPLPERRRRVLADLRRMKNRRKRVAIITKNIGEALGLGLDGNGVLRTQPVKGDYGRVGRMMREHGDETVWMMACKAASAVIEGDTLDYLEACLRNEKQEARGDGRRRGQSRRDGYPETPDEYGDDWIV